MPRDAFAYLLDTLLSARDAVSFTEDMSFDDFVRDRRTQLSVLKSVEIVGEAAAQVGEDVRRANPDIPGGRSSGCATGLCMSTSTSTFRSSGTRFATTCRT